MMWNNEFKDLDELKAFLIKQLNYDEKSGFSFVGIAPKLVFKEIIAVLGKPYSINTESADQQTLQYNAWVNHPIHGKRDHHKLNALFWAFEEESVEIIRLHFDYFKTGEFVEPFYQFIKELFDAVIDKFGKPDKKVSSKFEPEISYAKGKHKFSMWSNTEGLRIQIK